MKQLYLAILGLLSLATYRGTSPPSTDPVVREVVAFPEVGSAPQVPATGVANSASAGQSVLVTTGFGAQCDGVTDDSAAFQAAATSLNTSGETLVVPPNATCMVQQFSVTGSLTIQIAQGGVLRQYPGSMGSMIWFTGALLRILGPGTIDGNYSAETAPFYTIQALLPAGSYVDVEDVTFANSPQASLYVSNFGGNLDVIHNVWPSMEQSPCTPGNYTTAINVQSGQPNQHGLFRFNENRLIGTTTPTLTGGSPGGVFFAPTTDLSTGAGNGSSIEAIGNYFYGLGVDCAGADVAGIHLYPRTDGSRIIGNRFEGMGFAAIAAKSVRDFDCEDNVILNGQAGTEASATSGAIYYTLDHSASVQNPRAVISGNIIDSPGSQAGTNVNGISVIGIPTSRAQDVVVANNSIGGAGTGIFVDYVTDIILSNNRIVTATNGVPLGEPGISIDDANGVVTLDGNDVTVGNGHGIEALSGNAAATLKLTGNIVTDTSPRDYATAILGVAGLYLSGNTWNATGGAQALYVGSDGVNNVGTFSSDSSNSVVAGTATVDYAHVTTTLPALFGSPVGGQSTAFSWCEASQALSAGTVSLPVSVYHCPHITYTGTLTAAVAVVFPPVPGACWDNDFTQIDFAGHDIQLWVGNNEWSTLTTAPAVQHVCYIDSAGKLYGNALTP